MTRYLDPIAAVTQPREDLIRYLLTAYPLRDERLRQKFAEQLQQPGIVWQHPYLEGAQPYEPGSTVQELISQEILHSELARLFVPNDRRLYQHQQKAIAAVVQQQQNIIVATGTGSGKTECFLIPMIDILFQEGNALRNHGVRTLILYPMNALVNDQVKRLRLLLSRQTPNLPLIRFGFYTSRTEKKRDDAENSLRKELDAYEAKELQDLFTIEEKSCLNLSTRESLIEHAIEKIKGIQAISREEIWESPPHILVTNYSMLEHMLIRPLERTRIFQASQATFKMIVVDEAHTYHGSTGAEVSMLLKRLKEAVKPISKTRCIATSASLGSRDVDSEVVAFASQLFDEPFSQVIRGDRVAASTRLGNSYELPADLGNEDILEYLSILKLPALDASPEQWSNELSYIIPSDVLTKAQAKSQKDPHQLLWFALEQHPLIHRLINLLCTAPQPWEQVAKSPILWGFNLPVGMDGDINQAELEKAKQALAKLLQLGTLARKDPDDLPLLPVRLHLLFRSLEGLYGCVNPDCRSIYLSEKQQCETCNSPVLELGSCSQCGQAYLFTLLGGEGELQPLPRTTAAIKGDDSKIYTLTYEPISTTTEDDDEDAEEAEAKTAESFSILHEKQGWIGSPSREPISPQRQATNGKINLAWYRQRSTKGLEGCYLPKCAACGIRPNRTQAINRFIAYTDAPLEAMVDSLFELLPEPSKQLPPLSERKLLTFSDGRQDAAFFASDYQRTHTELLYRQLVWQAFKAVGTHATRGAQATITQVTQRLKEVFLHVPIAHPDRESDKNYRTYVPGHENSVKPLRADCEPLAEARAKELLLREFAVSFARRSSLEGYTTLACHLQLENPALIQDVSDRFQLPQAETHLFLLGLTDIIRRAGIVSIQGASSYFPETGGVDGGRRPMIDPAQGHSLIYLLLAPDSDIQKRWRGTISFMPLDKPSSRLTWYYQQVFGAAAIPSREAFTWLFQKLETARILKPAPKVAKAYHLDWDRLVLSETQEDWYQCDQCRQTVHMPGLAALSSSNLNFYACRAFRCQGRMQPYSPDAIEQAAKQHYYQSLIKGKETIVLRSQEHTAQLGTEELAQRENRFRRGEINLLSCSTTLEMGVDIGELQAVVLRNFPPHVSNYQQRAGRAGRRTDGVAITLMYGQRRPHDRFYFEQPERLIAGTNQIPKLDATNWQIQQRHIRAELIAAFLSSIPEAQNVGTDQVTIGQFFQLPIDDPDAHPNFIPSAEAMTSGLVEWLKGDPAIVLAQQWLQIIQGKGNAQDLLAEFEQAILNFQQQQLEDWQSLVEQLNQILQAIEEAKKDRNLRQRMERRRDGIEAELDKIAKRRLHEELVRASVLPIYGFPIDVVRLLTGESDLNKSGQSRHRLERDRRIALSEYAPGQNVVVDDRVYRSVGIRRPQDAERKYYWICRHCNHFRLLGNSPETIDECPVCNQEPSSPIFQRANAYIVPKVFVTDWAEKPDVPPYNKPLRQPVSQVFLMSSGEPREESIFEGICRLETNQNGQFFLANRGPKKQQGFAICQTCGCDLSDKVQQEKEKASKQKGKKKADSAGWVNAYKHTQPLTGKDCNGRWTEIHLGHEFRSDFLTIEFNLATRPLPLFDQVIHYLEETVTSVADRSNVQMGFWYSLTYAILAAAAEVADVRREEVDGLFSPQADGSAKIVIYDNVPGGAGYSQRIANEFSEILVRAYELVESCSCDSSCYDCLRTYSNQLFHTQLDRRLVMEFLQKIVERIRPDQELKAYGPGTHRMSLAMVADRLPALFRLARPHSK